MRFDRRWPKSRNNPITDDVQREIRRRFHTLKHDWKAILVDYPTLNEQRLRRIVGGPLRNMATAIERSYF